MLAPKIHPDRKEHFGVQDILRFQLLHQAIRDEFVVFRSAQPSGDSLEGHQEASEVGVLIKLGNLFECALGPVALLQFEQRVRFNRAFEMKVKFGLR